MSSNSSTYGRITKPQSFGRIATCSCSLPEHAFTPDKTLANFQRIVKVGVKVALVLLARYNVQNNAEHHMIEV